MIADVQTETSFNLRIAHTKTRSGEINLLLGQQVGENFGPVKRCHTENHWQGREEHTDDLLSLHPLKHCPLCFN